jgi:hypothetical protein
MSSVFSCRTTSAEIDPQTILREAGRTLDFTQPVALTMMQVSGHIADYQQARSIIGTLMEALSSGSYFAFNDSVSTHRANAEATRLYNETGAAPYRLRSPEQLAGFFDGLELLEPGVVPLNEWRPHGSGHRPRSARRGGGGWSRCCGRRHRGWPSVWSRTSSPRWTSRP